MSGQGQTIVPTTLLDQIEVRADGTIQVRLSKAVLSGSSVISSEYHRFTIPPGSDFNSGAVNKDDNPTDILGQVNAHLKALGFSALSKGDVADIEAHCQIAQTPDKIKAYEASLEKKAMT